MIPAKQFRSLMRERLLRVRDSSSRPMVRGVPFHTLEQREQLMRTPVTCNLRIDGHQPQQKE